MRRVYTLTAGMALISVSVLAVAFVPFPWDLLIIGPSGFVLGCMIGQAMIGPGVRKRVLRGPR